MLLIERLFSFPSLIDEGYKNKMTSWMDENLAMAPMPSEDQIEVLAKTFKAVVILVEDWQLEYNPRVWSIFGTDVLHLPIPDFGTPSLDELCNAVEWINRAIATDKKILVHCIAGRGRSGTVAAAYLISTGFGVDEAIEHVRARVHGAIETYEQEELLRRFNKVQNTN